MIKLCWKIFKKNIMFDNILIYRKCVVFIRCNNNLLFFCFSRGKKKKELCNLLKIIKYNVFIELLVIKVEVVFVCVLFFIFFVVRYYLVCM